MNAPRRVRLTLARTRQISSITLLLPPLFICNTLHSTNTMNTIAEDPPSPTSQPMQPTRSRGRKRRGTVNAPPLSASAAIAQQAELGPDGRRQSVIPSMTASNRLSLSTRSHDEPGQTSDMVRVLLIARD